MPAETPQVKAGFNYMSTGVYIRTKKTRENLSKSHIGKAGFWIGKKRSPEDIEKFRKSHLGKKQSEITKKKRSRAFKGKRLGKDNPNWKGGVSRDKHNGRVYEEWTLIIFKRNDFVCANCNKIGGKLNVHHIKNWRKYLELRYDIKNGIVLCEKCHKEFHKRYGKSNNTREQLKEFLK